MRKACVDADHSYDECMARAEEEFTNGNRSNEAERKLKYARNRIEKTLETSRKNVESAAGLYGVSMDWITKGTTATATIVNGEVKPTVATPSTYAVRNNNRTDAKAKTNGYVATVDALRTNGLEKEAKALESGEMPIAVAADLCEENGILCDENGTYSLRDVFAD